ncbi:MAG: peptide-methionine (S)-S-oxide reductase [Hymenobacter sp.]
MMSYQSLVDIFLTASHNPTELNRQGPDTGPEYRSAMFYRTPEEKKTVEHDHRQGQRLEGVRQQNRDRRWPRSASSGMPKPTTRATSA